MFTPLMLVEFIANVFNVWSSVLAVLKYLHSWTLNIICILGYIWIFWEQRNYANLGLQLLFLGQAIYGLWQWKTHRQAQREAVTYSMTQRTIVGAILATGGLFGALYYLLSHYTDGQQVALDSFTTALSLLANWLLAHKLRENWLVWSFVNIFYIALFISGGLYISAFAYLLLFANGIWGYFRWQS